MPTTLKGGTSSFCASRSRTSATSRRMAREMGSSLAACLIRTYGGRGSASGSLAAAVASRYSVSTARSSTTPCLAASRSNRRASSSR